MSSEHKEFKKQPHLILRFPNDLARRVRELMNLKKSKSDPLDVVDVIPADPNAPHASDFTVILEGKAYPALLMNLPTPVEAHKTIDNKLFHKVTDIGQILQVFHKEEERKIMKAKICKTIYGEYAPNGLTPPTENIVKRRFEKTRDHSNYQPYQIRQILSDIEKIDSQLTNASAASNTSKISKGKTDTSNSAQQPTKELPYIETVYEEIIPFEEWMLDPETSNTTTRVIELSHEPRWDSASVQLLMEHPELLVTREVELEDDFERLLRVANSKKYKQLNETQQKEGGAKGVNESALKLTLHFKQGEEGNIVAEEDEDGNNKDDDDVEDDEQALDDEIDENDENGWLDEAEEVEEADNFVSTDNQGLSQELAVDDDEDNAWLDDAEEIFQDIVQEDSFQQNQMGYPNQFNPEQSLGQYSEYNENQIGNLEDFPEFS